MTFVRNVISIILGGGRGTRLFPLTHVRSKPAVPLGGKYRLVDIPISNCVNSGINKVFVVTQYNSASLNRHVNQTYRFGIFNEGFVDILAAEQTPESGSWFAGTADAVRRCERHLNGYQVDMALILSGDQIYRMDYRKVIEQHLSNQADLTVCVIPVAVDKAGSFGVLRMGRDGRLSEFHEKPSDPAVIERLKLPPEAYAAFGGSAERPLMASMGIYLFNLSALREMLEDEEKIDFGKDVIPGALDRYRVFGFPFDGYWEDIGTISAFYTANLDLTKREPEFTFFDSQFPIYTHPRFLPASRIRNCRIEESVVAEGCSIFDARIGSSIIGIRSVIRDADLDGTLMMGADYYDESPDSLDIRLGVGGGTVIRRAIVDKNARIGRNVKVLNPQRHTHFNGDVQGQPYYIRDGIVIIPKDSRIPDGTEI